MKWSNMSRRPWTSSPLFKRKGKHMITISGKTDIIIHSCYESPFAYKPMEEIDEAISDTAEIIDIMKPVFNSKAH